ncbi:MAG TPA: FHA domain-containing protein [Polyangia bacterium]|nr:FHA domain-containing protein [Polyangia bacterium]
METGAAAEAACFPLLPHLVVVAGEGIGRAFALTKATTTIGRDPSGDIVLSHATVSWRHAAVTVGRDGIVAEDLGSLNGTFVGLDRIERRPLADGDVLGIGDRMVLKLTSIAAPEAPVVQGRARARDEAAEPDSSPRVASASALVERLRIERASAGDERVSLVLMFVRVLGTTARAQVPEPIMRRIAATCRSAMAPEDLLARASGRDLVLLLRKPIGRAVRMAREIRAEIRRLMADQLKGTSAAGGPVIATAALVPLPGRSTLSAEALLLDASRKAGRCLRRVRYPADQLPQKTQGR